MDGASLGAHGTIVHVWQTVHNTIRQCIRVVNHGLLAFQLFQYVVYLIHILML